MKKLLILLISCLATTQTFSQDISINEMVQQSTCKSYSCFNNFIISKDFTLGAIDNTCCEDKLFRFYSDKYYKATKSSFVYKNQCYFLHSRDTRTTEIGFYTRNKYHYQTLLGEVIQLGYTVTRESSIIGVEEGITTHYKTTTAGVHLNVSVYAEKDSLGEKTMVYYFVVKRLFNS